MSEPARPKTKEGYIQDILIHSGKVLLNDIDDVLTIKNLDPMQGYEKEKNNLNVKEDKNGKHTRD
jgi:hypothetical protein